MLSYHAGTPYESKIFYLTGDNWLTIHKILSVISVFLITIHLILHWSWLENFFSSKHKNQYNKLNMALLALFFLTNLTSMLSWIVFQDTEMAKALRGVHNKLGLILIIFFVFHLKNYTNWLVSMTKMYFR